MTVTCWNWRATEAAASATLASVTSPNSAVERTAGSHALAATALRGR
jgi:hypothetical protein